VLFAEHAQNYLLLSCLEDEMNGKHARAKLVARQSQVSPARHQSVRASSATVWCAKRALQEPRTWCMQSDLHSVLMGSAAVKGHWR
jgi:hypothetical protein